jgi:hypothetical protein
MSARVSLTRSVTFDRAISEVLRCAAPAIWSNYFGRLEGPRAIIWIE